MLSLLGPLLLGTTGFYRRTHTYLDQEQVLTYDPAVGTYSVLQMIRGAQLRDGACPVFNPMPLRRGVLPTYRTHTYLGDDLVLSWRPRAGGRYEIRRVERHPDGGGALARLVEGTLDLKASWSADALRHRLVSLRTLALGAGHSAHLRGGGGSTHARRQRGGERGERLRR